MSWPDTRNYGDQPVATALPRAFAECHRVVAFVATGVAVRLLAPLLTDKDRDPGVVCVDEAGRFAVALLGGHTGGANALAQRVAEALGAVPVVTTATDAVGLPGLDDLGWPVEGAHAAVTRAVLDGEPVMLSTDYVWPLPALPDNVVRRDPGPTEEAPPLADPPPCSPAYRILVTDRAVEPDATTVVLRPPSLVVGVGASRGVAAAEVGTLVDAALESAGLSPRSVRAVATVDAKADEAGLLEAATARGWPVVTHPADVLAEIGVPHPSEVVRGVVGTPSVAEAAALVGDGGPDRQGELVVTKRRSAMATVAVARHPPRGRLALVGLGPGARDLLTPRAAAELRRASVVVGLDQYVDQVRDLLRPGTTVLVSGLGAEEERARTAVEQARAGRAVALVGSGDAGVYALASPALEVAGADIDVVGAPGVTAALAAAALLGAPLGHDHASISLSDLHTPWEAIEARLRAAAQGDFVVVLYNPRSHGRVWQLPTALGLLAQHRRPDTPIGVVRQATRADEQVRVTTLAEFDVETVDMLSVVVVGSTNTRVVAGRMVTPRGYRWIRR